MCGYGASRQITSGGLSPNGKVARGFSCAWGVVFASALRRVKTLGNPDMIGLGAVSATLDMVSLFMVVFRGG